MNLHSAQPLLSASLSSRVKSLTVLTRRPFTRIRVVALSFKAKLVNEAPVVIKAVAFRSATSMTKIAAQTSLKKAALNRVLSQPVNIKTSQWPKFRQKIRSTTFPLLGSRRKLSSNHWGNRHLTVNYLKHLAEPQKLVLSNYQRQPEEETYSQLSKKTCLN